MTFRRSAAAAAMVIGSMTIALGTAHADPAPTRPQIDYSAAAVGRTVVTKLRNGTFRLVDKPGDTPGRTRRVVDVIDRAGAVALEMPLEFRVSGVGIPVGAVLRQDGRELDLTPARPAGVNLRTPIAPRLIGASVDGTPLRARPVASAVENQRAINDFATKAGLAFAVGGLIGAVLGGLVGCVLTFWLVCIPGLVLGGVGGGVLGTILAGGPSLNESVIDLQNTLKARDGTTEWANPAAG